ncbi:hypothetical protein L596_014157 [Steinernema carpocapsae]|uniref:DUF4781 domain-containing protein n=1 Tax=Steinernema carpocapsae TaxID=34508 RepID=A0A4U5NAX4_STECR|nr:hypothetical protein L596_014157 [Steinernema carpocapsae]
MEYFYPKFGYYTCEADGEYGYSEKKSVILEYGKAPSSAFLSQLGRAMDTVSGVTSLVAGGAAIVSMFTPVGPIVGGVIFASGAGSAVYGAGRSIDRLVDKGRHGESLKDLESFTSYFAICLTPSALPRRSPTRPSRTVRKPAGKSSPKRRESPSRRSTTVPSRSKEDFCSWDSRTSRNARIKGSSPHWM